jgi:hypothetical protein
MSVAPIIRGDRTPIFDVLWRLYLKYGLLPPRDDASAEPPGADRA